MRFRLHQRVTITDPDADRADLKGRTGKVVRLLRRSDDEAWVDIDGDPIPSAVRKFPSGDTDGRGNHVCLFGDECEELKCE
jgi:hypothetical protein